ncbi:substrate-binding domain-containing protein [Rhodococcus sp. 14-2483-1-2]|uniref:substrate-binding domain-containing protein n=1 Tax=Rhodococcus sp. 14-2483-1-2 TaxID=2023147 RepID=UPI00207B7BAA|nr:substrate-binding domain-containing protein [Rhodococcus sp. 14-2483-1-2]
MGSSDAFSPPSPVRIAGPSELLCTRVLPALASLVAEGVELRLAQVQTDDALEEMRIGRHDMIVATRRPRGRAVAATPLADEEYVLVASPLWWGTRELLAVNGPSALRETPLIAFADDLPILRRYWREVFSKRLDRSPAVTVPNLYAVLSAVVAGAGFSVLPRSLCRDQLHDGRLVVLVEPAEAPLNTLFLVERPGALANPSTVRVRERLIEAARDW